MRGKKMSARERREKLESDREERKRVFRDLCRHVEGGYSLDSFPVVSDTTVRKYLREYPEEFIEEELADSMRKGKVYWESVGRRQAEGTCLGNSRSWYYNMANRYGWRERVEVEAEHKGTVNVNVVSYASKKPSTSEQEK